MEPTSTALTPEKPWWSRAGCAGGAVCSDVHKEEASPCALGPGEVLQVDGELGGLGDPKVLAHSCAQAAQTVR